MIAEVESTLQRRGELFPDLKGSEYEITGFVWFQGWNDMVNADYTAEYATNMANFIRDVREDLGQPDLPFVIGQLGVGGIAQEKRDAKKQAFKDAQAAPAKLPEFKRNLAVVKTDQYWDMEADAVFKKAGAKTSKNGIKSDRTIRFTTWAAASVTCGWAKHSLRQC